MQRAWTREHYSKDWIYRIATRGEHTMMIRARLSIGFHGAVREDDIYVDDNATEDQINDEVRDWAHNYIDWSYERIEEPESVDAVARPDGVSTE